jgi:hypothetical protein
MRAAPQSLFANQFGLNARGKHHQVFDLRAVATMVEGGVAPPGLQADLAGRLPADLATLPSGRRDG